MTVQEAFSMAIEHHRAGQLAEAMELYRRILAHQPEHAESHYQLGCILYMQGYLDGAIGSYQSALALRPGSPQALIRLADVYLDKGDADRAMEYCLQSLRASPEFAEAHNTLGNLQRARGDLDSALAAFEQALRLDPNLAPTLYNVGNIYHARGYPDEALAAYRRAVEINPNWLAARNNLAGALAAAGQTDEAIAVYQECIRRNPEFGHAHYNMGLAMLRKGDFARGFDEYEWRWRVPEMCLYGGLSPKTYWDGKELHGRRILLYGELGFGDVIQCARYWSEAGRRGGEIILVCPIELQPLLKSQPVDGIAQFVREWVAVAEPFPRHDVHCPLMSMPKILNYSIDAIPADVPYIRGEAKRTEYWRDRLGEENRLRIGVAWAGRSTPDPLRSMRLEKLAPLANLPGIRWISLHKGEASAQAKAPPRGMELIDWTADFEDFSDTAALIENLDLVISVDTGVAHLAGAMGKPVWTMLPFLADWRWFLERSDSPWYPTMRLFRQKRPREWEPVIAEVGEALKVFCAVR